MQGGQRIEPKLVSVSLRARTNSAECVLRKRVDLTVVATVKLCGGEIRVNRLGVAVNPLKATVTKRIRRRGERA